MLPPPSPERCWWTTCACIPTEGSNGVYAEQGAGDPIIFVDILPDKGMITTFTALLMAIGSTMLTVSLAIPMLERLRLIVLKSE